MITIAKAPKFRTVCQSCMETKIQMWEVSFTSHSDEHSSYSVAVSVCTQCLEILGALASKVATRKHVEVVKSKRKAT